jgi:hypothetical protein
MKNILLTLVVILFSHSAQSQSKLNVPDYVFLDTIEAKISTSEAILTIRRFLVFQHVESIQIDLANNMIVGTSKGISWVIHFKPFEDKMKIIISSIQTLMKDPNDDSGMDKRKRDMKRVRVDYLNRFKYYLPDSGVK